MINYRILNADKVAVCNILTKKKHRYQRRYAAVSIRNANKAAVGTTNKKHPYDLPTFLALLWTESRPGTGHRGDFASKRAKRLSLFFTLACAVGAIARDARVISLSPPLS